MLAFTLVINSVTLVAKLFSYATTRVDTHARAYVNYYCCGHTRTLTMFARACVYAREQREIYSHR